MFVDNDDQWLGLITISHKTEKIVQTELILRRAKNPVGIMEALIFEIFKTLKQEGKELLVTWCCSLCCSNSIFFFKTMAY